jgi:glutamate decarboxylase
VTTFVAEVVGQLLEYIHTQREREQKVLEFHEPAEMKLRLANCLGTLKEPHNLQQLLNDIQTTLHYCVRTGKELFRFNFLSPDSLIGENFFDYLFEK